MAERYDEQLILGYIEGDLSPDQVASFEAQLGQDARLRNLVAQLLVDRNTLRAMPRSDAPAELLDRVNQSLERRMLLGSAQPEAEAAAPRRSYRFSRLLAYAALFIFVVGLIGVVVQTLVDPRLNNLATSNHAATGEAASSTTENRNALAKISPVDRLGPPSDKRVAMSKLGRQDEDDSLPVTADAPAGPAASADSARNNEKDSASVVTLADGRERKLELGLQPAPGDRHSNGKNQFLTNGSATNAVPGKLGSKPAAPALPEPQRFITGVTPLEHKPAEVNPANNMPGARVSLEYSQEGAMKTAQAIADNEVRSRPVAAAIRGQMDDLLDSLKEKPQAEGTVLIPDARVVISAPRADAAELAVVEWARANGASVIPLPAEQQAGEQGDAPGGSPRVTSQSTLPQPPVKRVTLELRGSQVAQLVEHLNARAGLYASLAPLPAPSRVRLGDELAGASDSGGLSGKSHTAKGTREMLDRDLAKANAPAESHAKADVDKTGHTAGIAAAGGGEQNKKTEARAEAAAAAPRPAGNETAGGAGGALPAAFGPPATQPAGAAGKQTQSIPGLANIGPDDRISLPIFIQESGPKTSPPASAAPAAAPQR